MHLSCHKILIKVVCGSIWLLPCGSTASLTIIIFSDDQVGPLHDPVTWYKITHARAQVTLWDFQNKGRSRWTGTSCFVWEFPLCNLCPSLCDCVQYHVTRSCKGRTDTNDKTTDAEAWKTDVKHIASEVDCSPEHFAVDGNK